MQTGVREEIHEIINMSMRRKASTFWRRFWPGKTRWRISKWKLLFCLLSTVTSPAAVWRYLVRGGSVWWLTHHRQFPDTEIFVQINANGYWRQKGIPFTNSTKVLLESESIINPFFNQKPPWNILAKVWVDVWAWSPCGLWLCPSQLETLGWSMDIWSVLLSCMTFWGHKRLTLS